MGRRPMTQFISFVVGGYLVFVAAIYLMQRNLLYYPDSSMSSPAASGVGEMTAVTLNTSDGLSLTSWYKPPAEGKPVLIYFHGNAGNISGRGFKVRPYMDRGYGVLLVGYRGYGSNPGSPTEDGLYEDGRAALAFAAAKGIDPRRIALYGESLGSGIAVQMALEMAETKPAAALILEAPFTSTADVGAHHYPYLPARILMKDRFESVLKIAAVKAPVLIFHGVKDRTIPVKFGKRLFKAAAEPKESHWYEDASHNDLYDFGAADLVVDFLERRI